VAKDDTKLERLTDLILALLDAPAPIPLSTLAEEIPGYPAAGEARRMAFERDKRLLREEGIDVEAVPIDGPEQYGYRIDPRKFFLPDLDLAPEEQAALNLAVAGVHLADDSGGDAMRKLGFVELSDVQPLASLAVAPGLDQLFRAISVGAQVRFRYRGQDRQVSPVRLRFSGGNWYLVGWAHERKAGRSFRVDRIEGELNVGTPGSGRLAADQLVEVDAPDEPWVSPGSPTPTTELRLLVDPLYAWRVVAEVGDERVIERRADGSVIVAVEVGREEAARSWLLSFLEHVEVLEPSAMRDSLIDWLEATVAAERSEAEALAAEDLDAPSGLLDASSPSPTQRRLRRLLAMLEWLATAGTVQTSEVARRFDMSEADVVAELELAACCGRPPFSPGELMDIVVDADQVTARLPEMNRPRQLTPSEGVALAAAARTILALPGADEEGPLARALAKLEQAIGEHHAVEVALERPPLLEALIDATDRGRSLEVEYLAGSTDELTRRVIDPLRVTAMDGRWYVEAYCHRAEDLRTFRADSFKAISDAGAAASRPDSAMAAPTPFVPAADADVAIIRVSEGAAWLADSVPIVARRDEGAGWVTVALAVAGPAWFDRILLQAGPDAVVVAPEPLLGRAAAAARRVLERYHPTV
jgi:predicted DNA-binding transcriptional regulator YafY